MKNEFIELLDIRRLIVKKINKFPYDGTLEIKTIKGSKYIYVRKRQLSKINSIYVGKYSEDLYNLLLKNRQEIKSLKRELKEIDSKLIQLGYNFNCDVPHNVLLNIDYAKRELTKTIYDQAILEGVATTYSDTESIIEKGIVKNMNIEDVLKILNLKNAWNFILDLDVIRCESDFTVLSEINRCVNEKLYYNAGDIRTLPVKITGCEYIPPVPVLVDVKKKIHEILNQDKDDLDIAIDLALFVMKTQVFDDGNKRTAIIYANHYLISKGKGLLVVPFEKAKEFKEKLVNYYDEKNDDVIKFMKLYCYTKIF